MKLRNWPALRRGIAIDRSGVPNVVNVPGVGSIRFSVPEDCEWPRGGGKITVQFVDRSVTVDYCPDESAAQIACRAREAFSSL